MEGLFLVLPFCHGFVGILLFEDSATEKEDRIDQPQNEEDRASDDRICQRLTRKSQKQEQGGDHNHCWKIGKNVKAGCGSL